MKPMLYAGCRCAGYIGGIWHGDRACTIHGNLVDADGLIRPRRVDTPAAPPPAADHGAGPSAGGDASPASPPAPHPPLQDLGDALAGSVEDLNHLVYAAENDRWDAALERLRDATARSLAGASPIDEDFEDRVARAVAAGLRAAIQR